MANDSFYSIFVHVGFLSRCYKVYTSVVSAMKRIQTKFFYKFSILIGECFICNVSGLFSIVTEQIFIAGFNGVMVMLFDQRKNFGVDRNGAVDSVACLFSAREAFVFKINVGDQKITEFTGPPSRIKLDLKHLDDWVLGNMCIQNGDFFLCIGNVSPNCGFCVLVKIEHSGYIAACDLILYSIIKQLVEENLHFSTSVYGCSTCFVSDGDAAVCETYF